MSFALFAASSLAVAQDQVAWIHNYDEALAVAKREGKPIFLDFWATW